MATICLNMIVKNESNIIEETLRNILDYVPIDYWVIADTGSTDNTPQIIQSFFSKKGINGKLVHHEWKNFGHNRQLALNATAGVADYVLFFDADDRFVGETKIVKNPPLELDAYSFLMKNDINSDHSYRRKLLIKNNQNWYWRGAVHEQLINQNGATISPIKDMTVISGRFGARNQDKNKYLKDAKMLEEEFLSTTDLELKQQDAYFIGQSYKDMNMFDEAFNWFNIALNLYREKSEQRRYILINLVECCQKMNKFDDVVKYLFLAYENSPNNAESLILLSRHFTNINELEKAFFYAKKSLSSPIPDIMDVTCIDYDLFNYERYNLFCHAAFNLGYYEDLYQGIKYLLFQPHSEKRNIKTILLAFCLPEIFPYLDSEEMEMKNKILSYISVLEDNDLQELKEIIMNLLR